ncbi:MAG: hypothetical protein QM831_19760 [Kofleriaceae bacterium]
MKQLALVALVFASACDVGSVIANAGGGDGGGGDDTPCPTGLTGNGAHTHMAGGSANNGMDCMAAGCHAESGGDPTAPVFSYAGTVYKDTSYSMTVPNVRVTIKVGGMTGHLTTDADGNFYDEQTLPDPSLSATAMVTACPGPEPMSSPLLAGQGSCNSSACHLQPGNAQKGIYGMP